MANLPVVIFQFALSPYEDWQQLAWAGALLITVFVLVLSICARVLAALSTKGSIAMTLVETRAGAPPSVSAAQAGRPPATATRPADKIDIRELSFYYDDFKALHVDQPADLRRAWSPP